MRKFLRQLMVVGLMTLISQIALASEDLKLVFAFDLIRHADRTPLHDVPEISNVWTKDDFGKLTELGTEDAQLLGGRLHKYYIDETRLLPVKLNLDLIKVRSTDYERTQDTASKLLQGLYPQDYEKIQILVVPKDQDGILRSKDQQNSELKPVIDSANEKFRASTVRVYEQAREAQAELNKAFGSHFTKPLDLIHAADLLNVSRIHSKPLVKHLDDQQAERIIKAGQALCLAFVTDHPKVACMRARALVLHITDLLHNKLSGSSQYKYILYSGHDSNIISAAFLLGAPQYNQPPYLSDLRFEMFRNSKTGTNFIKVSLDGEPIKVCADVMCPAEEFISTLRTKVKNQCSHENTGH